MSPQMGRPPKKGQSKTINLQLRINQETSDKLKQCAEYLNISRTEVIEKGIDIVFEKVKK